ncbi:probable cytochrome P450 301a1, mitochondrial [Uloborus diversus]|uniref:probable cytochrome P450 301a1, mitochondrial n=1 Tax=Uloborus diversus TaxID=327109 RepID=UPI002408FC79|nr:probable cytochrome P450 301a1, mitochondrial [Uloborus diversus]
MSLNAQKTLSFKTLLQAKRDIMQIVRSVTATNAQVQDIKDFKEMPGPRVVPVLGSAWVFLPIVGRYSLQKLHLAWVDKQRLYGDVIREKFGPLEFVFSFNPEHLDVVYENEGPYPSRGEFDTLKFYRESRPKWYKTTGVLATQGKEWWDLRSKTQKHLMKPKAIQAYLLPMQEVAKDFVQSIQLERDSNEEVADFLGDLYKWALESVALVGLDTRLGCLERNLAPDSDAMKMIRSVQAQFDLMGKLEMVPLYKYFSTPNWRRYTKASDIFSEIAFRYINNALNELKANEEHEDKELTLLQTLLLEKGLDLSGAMVTVADMLMAGIDTG